MTLFSKCSKGELKTVARHAETVQLEPGVDLTTQGAEGDAFYVILDGTADVVVDGKVVNQLHEGDWFGELALLDGHPRSATVTSVDDLEVAVLGRSHVPHPAAGVPRPRRPAPGRHGRSLPGRRGGARSSPARKTT